MVEGTVKATKEDNFKLLKSRLDSIMNLQVYVGIPEENASRGGEEPTNAELLYIHSNGSELRGLPARPVLEPTIEKNNSNISSLLSEAMKSGLDGDEALLRSGLEKAGLYTATKAQDYFTDPSNGWAENSPTTIRKKGSSQPLIDTGVLRKSITYVVGGEGLDKR